MFSNQFRLFLKNAREKVIMPLLTSWHQVLKKSLRVAFILLLGTSIGWLSHAQPATARALPESNFVTQTVKETGPAVVQVNVSRSIGNNVPDFLKPFLGGIQPTPPGGRGLQGIGSGFVLSKDGKILTNAHVVSQADTVMVSFSDGRVLAGEVLGKDPVTDVAVIQVEASDLPTVRVGDSDAVEQGEWAIAIGNPLGLQKTVTVGVISATHRFGSEIGVPDKRIGFIQTDAAINPGNSGGPLLNENGEVIGINSAIIGGAQGLGFAIPINTGQQIAEQLIARGTVEHPYIGIQMMALNPLVKEQINRLPGQNIQIEADQGILVMAVERQSPAAKAGLRPGDTIQRIDGEPVNDAEQVQRQIEAVGIGNALQLEVQREQQTLDLTVEPQQLPSQMQ
jgi:S1-C subfamily serine protease